MANSMTGFGRAEFQNEDRRIAVEIKSVNHRYLDLNVKMPRRLAALESMIRNTIKEYAERGKVDVFITCDDFSERGNTLRYNRRLAEQYVTHAKRIAEEFSIENDLTAARLLHFQDVVRAEDDRADEASLGQQIVETLRAACRQFTAARAAEGEALVADLSEKLTAMHGKVEQIVAREPEIMEAYRARLRSKLAELMEETSIDESRIAAEMVIFSDKICTDEETVRLMNHIKSMQKVLRSKGAIGRKLDFMAQEMNREANTILSKTNDMDTSDLGIDLKTEIEKIREQIQNIE